MDRYYELTSVHPSHEYQPVPTGHNADDKELKQARNIIWLAEKPHRTLTPFRVR